MATATPETFMARALTLARRGLYTTDPNPRVGCVLVKAARSSVRAIMSVPASPMPKSMPWPQPATPRVAPPPMSLSSPALITVALGHAPRR